METKNVTVKPKRRSYQVVAVVESRRCAIHGAVLVSEAHVGPDGEVTVPLRRHRKVLYCPFCRW